MVLYFKLWQRSLLVCHNLLLPLQAFYNLITALFRHTYLQHGMINFYFSKDAELEQINEMHSKAVLQIQEEHSNTLCKLGETVAEFERYLSFIKF